jgi:hypothetical protein
LVISKKTSIFSVLNKEIDILKIPEIISKYITKNNIAKKYFLIESSIKFNINKRVLEL